MDELPATSVALVMHENGDIEVTIPNHKAEDEVPEHVLLVTAAAMMITKDPGQLLAFLEKQRVATQVH